MGSYNTILNLELLTDSENLEKQATPFDEWLATRDANFKQMHLIPDLSDYGLDHFDKFVEARQALIENALRAVANQ